MKKTSLFILIFCAQHLFAQTTKTSIWVAPLESDNPNNMTFAKEARSEIVESFIKFGSFSVVDREASQLVQQELELQKTEAFMDGKVVEQGKAIGAEFIAKGYYHSKESKFVLKIVDVSTGNTVETDEYKMDFFAANYRKHLRKMVYRLANRWLSGSKITVMRSLEDKGESTQRVLLAGGSGKGLKVGTMLEVFTIEIEEVEGESLERFAPIGKMKVDKVENANFANAKIRSGEKEVFKHFAANKKLYARIIQN
ncbi:MAG: hypothetical protein ACKVT2_00340 [Saprospiraceae bacterium]